MNKRIQQAKEFATQKHAGQTRKGPKALPYVTHCAEVAAIVAEHGGDDDAIIAGWLHDTVEDTDTSLSEIASIWGPKVAGFVDEVTDDPDLSKDAQRAAQIASAPHKSAGAAMVKAADQLSNLRSLVTTPPYWSQTRATAYIKKAEAVVAGLVIPTSLSDAFQGAVRASQAKVRDFSDT